MPEVASMAHEEESAPRYDAFISYSHRADREIAASLQGALERFARPFYRGRAMRVFRDTTNLSANPDLWGTIEAAVTASRTLVLLTSPEAARSEWIPKEVAAFVAAHGAARVCIVRTRGELPWLGPLRDVERVLAAADCGVSREVFTQVDTPRKVPLVVDLAPFIGLSDIQRSRSSEFRDAVASVAAAILGKDKDAIYGLHIRRQRIFLAVLGSALLVFSAVAAFAVIQYVHATREAERAAQQALRAELELHARITTDLLRTSDQSDAIHRAVADTATARARLHEVPRATWLALWQAVEQSREVRRFASARQVRRIALSSDGTEISVLDRMGLVTGHDRRGNERWRWRAATEQFATDMTPSGTAIVTNTGALFRLDGRQVWTLPASAVRPLVVDATDVASQVVYATSSSIVIHDVARDRQFELAVDGPVAELRIARSGERLVIAMRSGAVSVYQVDRGAYVPMTSFAATPGSVVACDPEVTRVLVAAQRAASVHPVRGSPVEIALELPSDVPAAAKIAGAAITSGGRAIFTFENSGVIVVRDAGVTAPALVLRGSDTPTVAISKDGSVAWSGDYLGGTVREFDLTPRTIARIFTPPSSELTAGFAVCDAGYVWGGQAGTLRILRGDDVVERPRWQAHEITSVACLGRDGLVITGDGDVAVVWQLGRSGERVVSQRNRGITRAVGVGDDHADGEVVALAGGDTIVRWRPGTDKMVIYPVAVASAGALRSARHLEALSDHTIVVAGDAAESNGGLAAVRLHLEPEKFTTMWSARLPGLTNVYCATETATHAVLFGGTFDQIVEVTARGATRVIQRGTLRPGAWSIAAIEANTFAAGSLWGRVALFTDEGEYLHEATMAFGDVPIVVRDRRGLVVADAYGGIWKVDLGIDALFHRVCAGSLDPLACLLR